MPVQPTYPGVYVTEKPSGSVAISAVATSIALFIGRTQRGPVGVPTLILNRSGYEKQFGTDTAISEMTDQVRQFLLNGGSQAYVMRIVDGTAATASADTYNELGELVATFSATGPGSFGESVRFTVDYNTSRPESTFNLTVYREALGAGGQLQSLDTERHLELSLDPASPRYAVDYLAQASNLITASVPSPTMATINNGYSLAGALATSAAGLLTLVNNAIAAAVLAAPGSGGGGFEISVDEQAFVPVTLRNAPYASIPAILTEINDTLASAGLPVRINAGVAGTMAVGALVGLCITSDVVAPATTPDARSSVRIRRAAGANDIAGILQMSAADGAIEYCGATFLRPMANGIVARLFDSGATITPADTFLSATVGASAITISDPSPAPNAIPVTVAGAAGLLLTEGPAGVNLLATARANLDSVIAQFNSSPLQPYPARWVASRVGYRLVFAAQQGGVDFGANATIAVTGVLAAAASGGTVYLPNNGVPATPEEQANVRAYRLGAHAHGSSHPFSSGKPGGDGGMPSPGTYANAYDVVAREVDLFNLLILPRDSKQTDTDRAGLWGPASAFCRQRRAVLLVDPSSKWTDVTTAKAGVIAARTGVATDYAAIYWPRVTIIDSDTGAQRTVDPAGSVAGICARTDANRGVWKAPAGLEASLIVRGVERRMSNEENGVINPEALNAIRVFPNGIVVWGARTMDGFDNSGDTDYRYLPVRRTALMIEESLYRGLQFVVFQPNDDRLWAQIRTVAGSFMNGLFRLGAFQGLKTSDAYYVKCDSETTTPTDIALGIVNVQVGFAALRPAEFVVLTIQQMAGQVQA